jgi:2-oxoglutarate ferredoxin oxidoreductase subunit beta
MEPVPAVEWLEKNMIPVFPLGEIKNTLEKAADIIREAV